MTTRDGTAGGQGLSLADFDFDLPEALIATRPVRPRPAARLLVARGDVIEDRHVADLPDLLRPGDRLVINDTRVIPARLFGERLREGAAGALFRSRVEVLLTQALPGGRWRAMARPLKRLRPGDRIRFPAGDADPPTLLAEVVARESDHAVLDLAPQGGLDLETALERIGEMPLPPYIAQRRAADARDRHDYQTVFAARPGAVAAPTASLHFDEALLERLEARGIAISRVTLHVGAGTFLPVKVEEIERHRMHAEWGEVSPEAAERINATRRAGGRILPVGTTALRLIESAADESGRVRPFRGETDIFIRPGYRFRVADGLMTNFHLPRSTLMMLVAALMGLERIHRIYAHAIAAGYRFFSYGDASLLLPEERSG